ncbi:MAG TPA: TIGR00730 family Rossman fold protein, partial [Neisseria sp.]|nr:TIGR00730 family Rossman fold protein [Neisseria sp.]
MNHIVVYCGSNLGNKPAYFEAAQAMGKAIAERGSTLVYGGGKIGLMGTVADAALAEGGQVIGVIPTFLREKEVAHLGLSQLIETADMTERKNKMIELADAFIALPGGLGT